MTQLLGYGIVRLGGHMSKLHRWAQDNPDVVEIFDIWYSRPLRLWAVWSYDEISGMETRDPYYCLTKTDAFEAAGLSKMKPKDEAAYKARVKAMMDRVLSEDPPTSTIIIGAAGPTKGA